MRSERGSVLILVALSTVVLLSVAALSIDASFAFDLKDRLGAVADAAAKSAAFEVKHGNTAFASYAQAEIDRSITAGLIPAGTSLVSAKKCTDVGATCSTPYATSPGYVEVILEKQQPTFFGTIMGLTSLTPRARAVAGTAQPVDCFIAMQNLYMKNATIQMDNCGARVGGSVTYDNNPADIIGPVSIAGSCSGTHCSDSDTATNQPYPDNPYANLGPPATVPASCPDATGSGTLAPGCYHDIPKTITNFAAGRFIITGTLNIHDLTAPNNLIYLTSTGRIAADNNSDFHITASNSFPGYEGIAIYGDPGSNWDMTFTNHFQVWLTGAIAMAGSDLDIKNALEFQNTGCAVMVFRTWVQKAGNAWTGSTNCEVSFPGAVFLGIALAE